jgi:hypothetical protein
MNLLQILNSVLAESSFLEKGSFAGSNDPDDKQMVAIANRAAREIRDFYDWSAMASTFTLTIIPFAGKSSVPQSLYDLPDDYRSLVPDSVWETDGSRKADLPVPRNRWFMYKYSSLTDSGTMRARIYGNQIEVNEPNLGESFQMEYISKYTVQDSDLSYKELFNEDTDTFRLNDNILILGVQAWWARGKMMPMAEQWYDDYQTKLIEAVGRDNAGQTIGGNAFSIDRRSPYYPLYRRT